MANNIRGKRGGNQTRGGSIFRPSTLNQLKANPKVLHSSHDPQGYGVSDSARVEDASKFFDFADVAENHVDHVVPRMSITVRDHLGAVPQLREFEQTRILHTTPQTFRTYNKKTHRFEYSKTLVTDELVRNKTAWKSPSTLLRTRKPMVLEDTYLKRTEQNTGHTTAQRREEPAVKIVKVRPKIDLSR